MAIQFDILTELPFFSEKYNNMGYWLLLLLDNICPVAKLYLSSSQEHLDWTPSIIIVEHCDGYWLGQLASQAIIWSLILKSNRPFIPPDDK
mgnify:CR=1 FL=1